MRRFSIAIVTVFVLCVASLALARGAPTKEKTFSDQSTASVHVAPATANVPPMTTGFDVIKNLSTSAYSRLATADQNIADTSVMREQSTTGDEDALRAASYSARSSPNLALGLRL